MPGEKGTNSFSSLLRLTWGRVWSVVHAAILMNILSCSMAILQILMTVVTEIVVPMVIVMIAVTVMTETTETMLVALTAVTVMSAMTETTGTILTVVPEMRWQPAFAPSMRLTQVGEYGNGYGMNVLFVMTPLTLTGDLVVVRRIQKLGRLLLPSNLTAQFLLILQMAGMTLDEYLDALVLMQAEPTAEKLPAALHVESNYVPVAIHKQNVTAACRLARRSCSALTSLSQRPCSLSPLS